MRGEGKMLEEVEEVAGSERGREDGGGGGGGGSERGREDG